MGRTHRTINGLIARVLEEVEPAKYPSRVYLLLDPARDSRMHGAITTLGTRHHCIYGADVPPALARVAPHIVAVTSAAPVAGMFAREGRGKSWGMMFRSEARMQALAEHFYSLLRATLPGGDEVLFRYYDPRVLRNYLPTCNADELRAVFGPVESFLVEQADGEWLTYAHEDGALVTKQPSWDRWIDE